MTGWAERLDTPEGGAPRWLGAAAVIGALYATGLAWAMSHPVGFAMPASTPAVMIDLAPVPTAADTTRTEIGQDAPPAPDSAPAPLAPPPPPRAQTPPPSAPDSPVARQTPPAEVPPLPASDTALAPPPPPPAHVAQAPDASPRPETRPAPKAAPRPAPASKRVDHAAAQAKKAARTAARQSSVAAQASPAQIADWQARLAARLARFRTYPPEARSRGETGTVRVLFTLDAQGQVLSVRVTGSSGHADLDAAALQMVHRASPLPPPPARAERTISAPVRFTLN